jgi:wobble nucleotide-excising tRNase
MFMKDMEQAVKQAIGRHSNLTDSVASSKRRLEKAVMSELMAASPQLKEVQETIRLTRKLLHRKRLHRSRRQFCIKTGEKKVAKAREGLQEIEASIQSLERKMAEIQMLEERMKRQMKASIGRNLLVG